MNTSPIKPSFPSSPGNDTPQSTADSTLHDFVINLHPYVTGTGRAYDYDKYKTQAKTTLATDLKALLPKPRELPKPKESPSPINDYADYKLALGWNGALHQVNQIIDEYFGVTND